MPQENETQQAFTPVLVDTARGRVYARSQFELERELAAGGRLPDPASATLPHEAEFREYAGEQGTEAFMAGAAEALSGGLFRDDSYHGQVINEENPVERGFGLGAGLIGGALTGVGAPGIAAKAGSVASRGIASTTGRLAVEGAVDGLTYSFMRESIEAAAHDDPFSMEAVAAETLAGGGVGAAIGGAI